MHKGRRGFTLIEMVMVISLSAVLALGMANFIITSLQAWMLITQREAGLNNARTAMSRMVAEIRLINLPQNLLVNTSSECQFRDINSQTIDFKQSGTNLLRNSDVLATGLASPEGIRFTYLTDVGSITASRLDTRVVRIRLTIATLSLPLTIESSSRIRNLY